MDIGCNGSVFAESLDLQLSINPWCTMYTPSDEEHENALMESIFSFNLPFGFRLNSGSFRSIVTKLRTNETLVCNWYNCTYVSRILEEVLEYGKECDKDFIHIKQPLIYFLWMVSSLKTTFPISESVFKTGYQTYTKLLTIATNTKYRNKPGNNYDICIAALHDLKSVNNSEALSIKTNCADYLFMYSLLATEVYFLLEFPRLRQLPYWVDLNKQFDAVLLGEEYIQILQ